MQITVRIDDRELKRGLARLGPRMGNVLAKALNRTAFELRESEAQEASQSFDFAGPSTQAFLASKAAFRFDGATASKLEVRFHPRDKAAGILAPHVYGDTITADNNRLTVGGEIAVPVGVKIGARGRVAGSQTPGALLRRGRAFFAGKALLTTTGRGRSRIARVAYALVERFTLKRRYDYFETARSTAQRQFPIKAREEVAKLRVGHR